jgi:hypothetical protein
MTVGSKATSVGRGGDLVLWIIGVGATILVVSAWATGRDLGLVLVIALLASGVIWLGRRLTTEMDPWLPRLIALGFAAKLLGATARYLALVYVFGSGDASGYHAFAAHFASFIRDFDLASVLASLGNRGFGTNTTKVAISFLYTPYIPTMYGGFLEAATFSFLGQVGFYTAFRRWVPADRLKPYAILLFFLPTLLFWPSSVGKDALMIGALGLAAAGFSATLSSYRVRNIVMAGAGLTLATLVRPHVGMLLLGSVFVAMVIGRGPKRAGSRGRRLLFVGVISAVLVVGAPRAAQLIDVELSSDGIEDLIERQQTQTSQGGSLVQGSAVRSLGQMPGAAIRVLFRPLPNEASSMEMLASSLEGMALILLTLALMPRMLRRLKTSIRNPWVVVSMVYTVGFIVAFSTVLNLGILARQRAQVLPLFLALVIALGWRGEDLTGESGISRSEQVGPDHLITSVGI